MPRFNRQTPCLPQVLDGIAAGKEFHGDIAAEFKIGEFSKDAAVIDLASSGFMPAGDVGYMDDADVFNSPLQSGRIGCETI